MVNRPDHISIVPAFQTSDAMLWQSLSVKVRPSRTFRLVLGICLTTTAALVLVCTWIVYMGFSAGRFPGFELILVVILARIAWGLFERSRRVRALDAIELSVNDPRPPILLLREFGDDQLRMPNGNFSALFLGMNRGKTFGSLLCEIFGKLGPVIAVGRPGERVPHLGPARLWISNDDWQVSVEVLIQEAQLEVMVLGRLGYGTSAGGLRWETNLVLVPRYRNKVVFVVPPVSEDEVELRWSVYLCGYNGPFPEHQGGEIATHFTGVKDCSVAYVGKGLLRGYVRDSSAYERALRISKPTLTRDS